MWLFVMNWRDLIRYGPGTIDRKCKNLTSIGESTNVVTKNVGKVYRLRDGCAGEGNDCVRWVWVRATFHSWGVGENHPTQVFSTHTQTRRHTCGSAAWHRTSATVFVWPLRQCIWAFVRMSHTCQHIKQYLHTSAFIKNIILLLTE